MFCYPAVSWFEIIIGSINGKLPLYDALAIIANHFLFPDFSTRELYFFFCIALVIGVDSTPAAKSFFIPRFFNKGIIFFLLYRLGYRR